MMHVQITGCSAMSSGGNVSAAPHRCIRHARRTRETPLLNNMQPTRGLQCNAVITRRSTLLDVRWQVKGGAVFFYQDVIVMMTDVRISACTAVTTQRNAYVRHSQRTHSHDS